MHFFSFSLLLLFLCRRIRWAWTRCTLVIWPLPLSPCTKKKKQVNHGQCSVQSHRPPISVRYHAPYRGCTRASTSDAKSQVHAFPYASVHWVWVPPNRAHPHEIFLLHTQQVSAIKSTATIPYYYDDKYSNSNSNNHHHHHHRHTDSHIHWFYLFISLSCSLICRPYTFRPFA